MAEGEIGVTGNGTENAGGGFGGITLDNNKRDTGGTERINPAAAADANRNASGGTGNRKPRSDAGKPRGPRGSRTASGPKASISVDGLEGILLSIHGMLASIAKTPELEIQPSEAEKLAKAISAVQDQYPITKIDAKAVVWINLFSAMGMIYGPRMVAIKMRKAFNNATPVNEPVDVPQPAPVGPTDDAPVSPPLNIQVWKP